MVKEDNKDLDKMKSLLGGKKNFFDPTKGAGMNMDEIVDKLMKEKEPKLRTKKID